MKQRPFRRQRVAATLCHSQNSMVSTITATVAATPMSTANASTSSFPLSLTRLLIGLRTTVSPWATKPPRTVPAQPTRRPIQPRAPCPGRALPQNLSPRSSHHHRPIQGASLRPHRRPALPVPAPDPLRIRPPVLWRCVPIRRDRPRHNVLRQETGRPRHIYRGSGTNLTLPQAALECGGRRRLARDAIRPVEGGVRPRGAVRGRGSRGGNRSRRSSRSEPIGRWWLPRSRHPISPRP